MPKAGDFFSEIRRRHTVRVAILYIVGAWVVLQVADLAFPGLQIPESAIRFVWVGAIAGFPLALILGWRFYLKGGRIFRSTNDRPGDHQGLSRTDYTILASVFLVFAVITIGVVSEILATRTPFSDRSLQSNIDPKSIAVLPFTNMSGDESNEPFTIGIHDDVLTHISKIGDIKVISRTSVARLDPGMSMTEIGMLLGVATVLESGVQIIGNRVRINTQLVDTASDQHLWAETFDRELTTQHIFAIQSEIAAAITEKLQASLSPREQANLGKLSTQSLQAYEKYMLGQQKMITRTQANLESASTYFKMATELDPHYALAWVGLADANLLLSNYGFRSTKDSLGTAEAAIARALSIDKELGVAYATRGLGKVQQGDNMAAEVAFLHAIELDPNNPKPYHWYGDLLINALDRPGEAVDQLEQARRLDPLSPVINVTLGEALEASGSYDKALDFYLKAIEIEPDYSAAYYLVASYHRNVLGALDEAVRWHLKEIAVDPARNTAVLGLTYLDMGDVERAEHWIKKAISNYPEGFISLMAMNLLHRYKGEQEQAVRIARQLLERFPGNNLSLVTLVNYGFYDEALETIAPVYPELACNVAPTVNRNNLPQAINLSLAWEAKGDKECSGRLLETALRLLPSMPRMGVRGYGNADVEIYARQGRTEKALGALRVAMDEGFRQGWWAQAPGSPHMVSLLENPEFNAMMQEIRTDMSAQLGRIESLGNR